MNQTQRQFLLNSIEQQYKKERSKLLERKPKEPSLNNYLVASILDGTFVMKKQDVVRSAVRERVVKLGKKEALLCDSSDIWGSRRRQDEEDQAETFIKIPVSILFELPKQYAAAKKEYDDALLQWVELDEALEASFEAMKIKVQLGSDKALSALVDQADKLCSMSLTASSKLMLTNAP